MARRARNLRAGGTAASMASLTVPIGQIATDTVRFDTAASLDGATRMAFTPGKTALTDAASITLDTPSVQTPSVTFTADGGAAISTGLTVTGATTMQAVAARDVTATVKVVGNTYASRAPDEAIDVNARKIVLDADVEITGTLDTLSSQQLLVKDKVIKLGAADDDASDVARDGAGLVVPGLPLHMPAGTDAALYEHSLKWLRKSGDFKPDGTPYAPHNRPMWELNGGALGVTGVDHLDRPAQFFMAPHFTADKASLGLYYSVGDGRTKLVHTFAADAFAVPPAAAP